MKEEEEEEEELNMQKHTKTKKINNHNIKLEHKRS